MPDVTPASSDELGRVLILLEDIRAQNKATIEAVESGRRETSLEIQRLEARLTSRIEILEAVVRHHSEELRGIRSELASVKGDLASVKADLAAVKADLAAVKADLAAVKADLASVKATVMSLETKVDTLVALEARVTALERRGA